MLEATIMIICRVYCKA